MKNIYIKILPLVVIFIILFSGTTISKNLDIDVKTEQKIDNSRIIGVEWANMIGFITDLVEHENSIEFKAIFVYHRLFITMGRGFISERGFIRNQETVILDQPKGIITEGFIIVSYKPDIIPL
jgi:hypothetical protein